MKALLLFALLMSAATSARAVEPELVTSRAGLTAWLVRVPGAPLVSLRFALPGGSIADPPGQEGSSAVLADLLIEGAGPYDGPAFKRRAAELGARIRFTSGRDALQGSLDALAENLDQSVALLGLALRTPRLEESALRRVIRRKLAGLEAAQADPAAVAEDAWYAARFGSHPYARPAGGTVEGLGAITREDLLRFASLQLAAGDVQAVAVGDLGPERLAALLDELFGAQPRRRAPGQNPPRALAAEDIARAAPGAESAVMFGLSAPPREHPDFLALLVVNEILGGAPLGSRLAEELRVRRGLVYGVATQLVADGFVSLILGQFSCAPEACAAAVAAVRAELERLARDGPSEDEVARARDHLVGAFALSFDSNQKIADNLLGIRLAGYAPAYARERRAALLGITRERAAEAARRVLGAGDMLVVTAGPASTR